MSIATLRDARSLAVAVALLPMLVAGSHGVAVASECIGDTSDHGHDHGDLSEIRTLFALVDQTGSVVISQELFTVPSLVYFGYTFCPDICPFDNARNAEAVDILAERGVVVRPVFVTVDPRRDTPEIMADYTAMMHPRMVGLTGSSEQIGAVAEAFGVVYSDDQSDDEYYLVDHSTFTYLILPDRGVVDRFSRTLGAADMAEIVACQISRE